MDEVARKLDDWVARRLIPSASVCVRVAGREVFQHTTGLARYEPPRPATPNQPYDLASVTKALVGTTVAASLVEEGAFDLDDPVARFLGDVDGRVTVGMLLTHASGYPAWIPYYTTATDAWGTLATREAILERVRRTPLENEPGTTHVYSDVGMLVLLSLVETVTGQSIDRLFAARILDPARATDFRWGWPGAAATEHCPVRGLLVEGTVHDLNCASLGGTSTHAGLFGTARAVAGLADTLMSATLDPEGHPGLPGRTLARFWSTRGPGSHRAGWDGKTEGASSTGRYWPADTVGHLGYTGTGVWVAPSKRAVCAFLTNRVHPDDDKGPIREIRPLLYDAVAVALGWV